MRRSFRITALLTAVVGLAASGSTAVGAATPFPAHIDLPPGWQPEGITAGAGSTAFAGSLADGSIARVDLRTGGVSTLVQGAAGLAEAGVEYESAANRIWVAGAGTGQVRAYDATSGALLATYPFAGTGFLNDLVATEGAIYVTDSNVQQLLVIPLGADGSLPAPAATFSLPLSGDIVYGEGFNANGIVASDGWLIVVQSNTGQLFRVDPATGEARRIDLGGADVAFGDGLELHGSTLYVVQNQLNRVEAFRLADDLASASLMGTISSGDLDIPTTAAFSAGRLWLVNARFNTPPAADTPYWISQLPARP